MGILYSKKDLFCLSNENKLVYKMFWRIYPSWSLLGYVRGSLWYKYACDRLVIFGVVFDNLRKAKMPIFGVKFWARNPQNKLHHINFAKILIKFCPHKFSPKLNPIWEKGVLNFKFNAFFPVNLNQFCIRMSRQSSECSDCTLRRI